MPLLAPEPNVFPSDLFTDSAADAAVGRSWWVLHTKPRQEKSLARQLYQAHVPFYLPLIARRLLIRGRVLQSHVPLFGGYLFLLAQPEERIFSLSTKRIVQSLVVNDQETLWRDLRQVQRLIGSGMPVTPEDRLHPGALVEIRSGPLAGLKGKIMRAASGNRFVVEVDFIQKSASVLLDDYTLAAIDQSAVPERGEDPAR
jgi:transcriptional antiterminator RfaH